MQKLEIFPLKSIQNSRTFIEIDTVRITDTYDYERIVNLIRKIDKSAKIFKFSETENIIIDVDSGVNFALKQLKNALRDTFKGKYSVIMYDVLPIEDYEDGYVINYYNNKGNRSGTYFDLINVPAKDFDKVLKRYISE